MFKAYSEKLKLLIQVLPFVVEETCFALHGGTAINLFMRDMPRLSVDIDLTYLPLEDRATTLKNIKDALNRIKTQIEKRHTDIRIIHKEDIGKLIIQQHRTEIKLEVNLVGRGTLSAPAKKPLCPKAQDEYDAFVALSVVPFGQLYGGKICAALDRQHPRDLFDIKHLLDSEGITDDVRQGFLLCLTSSDRPINEVLVPNLLDQRKTLENQFTGMSDLPFSYDDFEETRTRLIQIVMKSLSPQDKEFLLSVKRSEPDWSTHDFERFPAVQWKLQNLSKLREANPTKHQELYEALKEKLGC